MRSIRATASRAPIRLLRAAALGLSVATAACHGDLAPPIPAAHDDDVPRRGGTLRLASFADIRGLDPARASDLLAGEAIHLVFAGLVDFDARGAVVPDLADRWELDDARTTYRFFLRPGVVMHDGAELTADDVKRSIERALHPTTPDPSASYFESIAGYDDYVAGRAPHLAGVEVESPSVVAIRLSHPDATFLSVLALYATRPVCRSGGDRAADNWWPCGAGPFKVARWQRGQTLLLERHERYFHAGLPYLDAVEWTYNDPQLGQRFRFEAGDLDVLRDVPQSDLQRYARDPRWIPFGHREADVTLYGEVMNTRIPPFDNVEVRRAVAAAIDRDHYRLLRPTDMTPLGQPIPPDVPGHDPDLRCQSFDRPAALEHMRRAGLAYDPATGRGGWPKPVPYLLYDKGLAVFTAQLLQQDLAAIGLHIDLRLVSFPAFLALAQKPGASAMSFGNWTMDFPDPSSFFEPLFTSASIGPEGGSNTAFYANPRFDDLVARGHRALEGPERRALYREASRILCDDAPWAFTFAYHWYDVIQPYVKGPLLHAVWVLDPTRVWLDRGDAPSRAGSP
ncbi:MAG TPA: ABC transporter substrate-binding protein [Polyangiaceae bacterium]|jgi:ABC-type transport system substrate-binding protein|nr:ABC transporter substrate-binding protein [Polyangiaceae bacterium]